MCAAISLWYAVHVRRVAKARVPPAKQTWAFACLGLPLRPSPSRRLRQTFRFLQPVVLAHVPVGEREDLTL